MTSFADPEVVRCPHCKKLALRLSFRSINTSGDLFPPEFQKISTGEVSCPHCNKGVDGWGLERIDILNSRWKQWIWDGIKSLEPRIG